MHSTFPPTSIPHVESLPLSSLLHRTYLIFTPFSPILQDIRLIFPLCPLTQDLYLIFPPPPSLPQDFTPMVAFMCNKPAMHRGRHGWIKDADMDCLQDPKDILEYCRHVSWWKKKKGDESGREEKRKCDERGMEVKSEEWNKVGC